MDHLLPNLGFGLGLRTDHYEAALGGEPAVDWFEALTENYLAPGGKPLHYLDRIRERYPVVLHGVSLSIGSTDPLNREHLLKLKRLADRTKAHWISDHLCWTGVLGRNTHDLLPMPYTEEALTHVVRRLEATQLDLFGGARDWKAGFYREGDAGREFDGQHLVGLCIAVLFLSLGAPFWFNLLRNASNLRPIVARKVDSSEA